MNRPSGRQNDQLRPVKLTRNYTKHAEGSVLVEFGDTKVLCTPVGGPVAWPAVAALVPARDEAEVIGAAVTALLAQDYPGPFQVVLIDDHSSDGTAALARRAAAAAGVPGRFRVVSAPELPPGWTGKLWALQAGETYTRPRRWPFVS